MSEVNQMSYDPNYDKRKATPDEVREFMCDILQEGFLAWTCVNTVQIKVKPEEVIGVSHEENRITFETKRFYLSFDLYMYRYGHIFDPIHHISIDCK